MSEQNQVSRMRTVSKAIASEGLIPILKRVRWEAKVHSGRTTRRAERIVRKILDEFKTRDVAFRHTSLFTSPQSVAAALQGRLGVGDATALHQLARHATHGLIESFSCKLKEYGNPIAWSRNPDTGRRWNVSSKWYRLLPTLDEPGDVKMMWEVARFPQAYLMARSAALAPEKAADLSAAFYAQVHHFLDSNPFLYGVQWVSGQEIVFRLIAWLFAIETFRALGYDSPSLDERLKTHLVECGAYLDAHIEYSLDFVYNNHLISEALGLCLPRLLLGDSAIFNEWYRTGISILDREADRQVYPDGGYIQQSNNYHRVVMQIYLVAASVRRHMGEPVPAPWLAAMERSLDFLVAQQNAGTGQLPNYGFNDGAFPLRLASNGYSDYRPTLQTLSLITRGRRLYDPGPWDEQACWLLGPQSLEAPLQKPAAVSVSFSETGFHVLRGKDPNTFALFRCGSIRDRFSQMDMLHLDVWWRGQNVLVDPGSYMYNGPEQWHSHFMSGKAHNTVTIDGRDQMEHLRRFKVGPLTRASLLSFQHDDQTVLCVGEHYGYSRLNNPCTHRRSVLLLKDDIWLVADTIAGVGQHSARLHWLAGAFPYRILDERCCLNTPHGNFNITVVDAHGRACTPDAASGQLDPPRGWLSRYYGERVAVPSLAYQQTHAVPITFVTILSPQAPAVAVQENHWVVTVEGRVLHFDLSNDGIIQNHKINAAWTTA